MSMLNKTLKDNRIFLVPYLVFLLFAAVILFSAGKKEIHLFINQHHTAFADVFFALATYLGDGWFIILPALILLIFSLRHFVFLITVYFSTGLVTQILKRLFFEDVVRPSKLLADYNLYIVEGVKMLSGRSFPSGHSTSAFALFLCLTLIVKNQTAKFVFFVLALLVAFSRVYLSQHFLIDITVGSIIGSTGAIAFYLIFYRDDRPWHAWSLKRLINQEKNA